MVIARAALKDGDELLILGLSRENRRRLEDGKPIDVSRETHGVSMPKGLKIMIFAGETEESMRQELAELIGPATVLDQKAPQ